MTVVDVSDLVVRGGPGGTTANLEDIGRCSAALRSAAQAVDDAASTLVRLEKELDGWGLATIGATPEQVHAASVARHARYEVAATRSPVLLFASDLRADARDLDRARARYGQSESFASSAFRFVVDTVFPFYGVVRYPEPFGELPTFPVVLAEHAKWRAGQGISADHVQRYVHFAAGQIVRISPEHYFGTDDPVPILAGWLARGAGALSPPKEVVVQPVIGGVRTGKASRGAKDMVDKFAHGRALGGPEQVQVTEVTNRDGSTAWEVTIPGTQDLGLVDRDHPNTMKANLELIGGLPSYATAAVIEAMRQAGVGKGDPVVLVGHSQGGMIAQQIAKDGGFNVVGTLTVGSPLGARHQRPVVPTLALEHESDLITAFDGKPNPDDPLTTTVSVDPDGRARQFPGPAHESAEYARLAELADQHDADSLVEWREIVSETFDDDAVARTRLFDVSLRDPS